MENANKNATTTKTEFLYGLISEHEIGYIIQETTPISRTKVYINQDKKTAI